MATTAMSPPATRTNMPPNGLKEGRKCTRACNYCRIKKIKCDGGPRCSACTSNDQECIYPSRQRRSRGRLFEENRMLMERIASMESRLRKGGRGSEGPMLPFELGASQSPHAEHGYGLPQAQAEEIIVAQDNPDLVTGANQTRGPDLAEVACDVTSFAQLGDMSQEPANEVYDFVTFDHPRYPVSPLSTTAQPSAAEKASTHDGGSPSSVTRPLIDAAARTSKDSSNYGKIGRNNEPLTPETLSPDDSPPEHHGPTSFLSICSEPGLNWVTERTGATYFTEYARALTSDISRSLKLQANRVKERAPEPDAQTAWKYCNNYFKESAEIAGGVVNRPAFEARLRAQLGQKDWKDNDPAWYALRNTVYASGCRFEMSQGQDSTSFINANVHAWRYFENALSVHTDLLYSQTGLMAVEALIAMSFFVEGLGSPALEYMLCSSAARLAQSKGLHLQPLRSSKLQETEELNRAWLFWTIYCYEKHIAYRSGRPSAIDDDNISCPIPTTVPAGSSINVPFLTACITHAQVASLVSRRLATVKAYQQTPRELIQTINYCTSRLEDWAESLPSHYQPTSTIIKYSSLPPGTHIQHVLYLKYSYFGTVLAINTILTHPWTSAIIKTDRSEAFRHQVELSTNAVVEASRAIILTTKYIDVDASSPVWLSFYYPFVGLLNLFLYIIKAPSAPTAPSDIALMDIVAGHFGRVEFLTSSEFSFPFIREITNLANTMVKRARGKMSIAEQIQRSKDRDGLPGLACEIERESGEENTDRMTHQDCSTAMRVDLMDELISGLGFINENDFGNIDIAEFDLDSWGHNPTSHVRSASYDATGMDMDADGSGQMYY